jgi:hypothetical protein
MLLDISPGISKPFGEKILLMVITQKYFLPKELSFFPYSLIHSIEVPQNYQFKLTSQMTNV